jgi:hypothetical protein
MDLLRQSSKSLAGRIAYVEMGPLNVLETASSISDTTIFWVRGGFPESYLASNDHDSPWSGARISFVPTWSATFPSGAPHSRRRPWSVFGPCSRTNRPRCSTPRG